jgi:predicted Rossmann fold nucleotide-binding protein DprA/Smf involved in DNA uptake
MAVPGTIVGGRNRGANALLRDGAKLVESAVDILQELGSTSFGARAEAITGKLLNSR